MQNLKITALQIQNQHKVQIREHHFKDQRTKKQMYQPNYHQYTQKEDPRMTKLRQDNLQLQKALKDLNECYQQKISLLEQELRQGKKRQQELLVWKSHYIDKELFNNAKYESQLEKMVKMMQEMAQNYERQNAQYRKQLEEKEEQINHLKDENTYLRQQRQCQDEKIQSLAQTYIIQIERLKTELKQLKEEVNYDDEEADEGSNLSVRDETESREKSSEIRSGQESIYAKEDFIEEDGPAESQETALKDISNHRTVSNVQKGRSNEKEGMNEKGRRFSSSKNSLVEMI